MGLVVFITIASIYAFIPLGIVKGLIHKKLLPEIPLICAITGNVILNLFGFLIFCFGGYYFSKMNLIGYNFHIFINILITCFAGSFLCFSDIVFIKKWFNKSKIPCNIFCFSCSWWCICASIFLIPLFIQKNMPPISNYNHGNKYIINLEKLSARNADYQFLGKELKVNSYPYGGIVITWGKRRRIINCQTFFYRWTPASFYFDHISGMLIFKTGRDVFLYDVKKDTAHILNTFHISNGTCVI